MGLDGTCDDDCKPGEYSDQGRCALCHPSCQTCEQFNKCTGCYDNTYLNNGQCIDNCTTLGLMTFGDLCVEVCPKEAIQDGKVCRICARD